MLHCNITDIEDLDHYEMKEEPISGKKLEDEGIEKENLAILEKIRQDHLNVITFQLILHLFEWCYLFSQEGQPPWALPTGVFKDLVPNPVSPSPIVDRYDVNPSQSLKDCDNTYYTALKEYWQRNSPAVPPEAKRNRKTNGSSPETSTSAGCHSPRDEQQKKQVEHQLEEEKKANNEKQKAKRNLEVQIQRLNIQKKKLTIDLYHTKRSLRYFEEQSKKLAGHLQRSSQHTEELERALSAVTATRKKKVDRSSKRSKTLLKIQLEQSLKERAQLKAHVTQMKKLLQQVQLERDEYAERIKGKRAWWQERMRKMSQELCTLKMEKQHNMHRVEELERSLSQLKNQMAEPLPLEPPAVPPEEELQHLRKELERVSTELQAQVQNHQHNNEKKSALHMEQQVEELQQQLHEVNETVTSTHKEPEAAVPAPGTGGESSGLMDLLEEKADLRECVEKLEHQFIQYWRERCHQKIKHLIMKPEGSAKEATPGGGHHQAGPRRRDEGGAPGAAGDAVAAWVDGNKGHSKFLAAAQNPADEPGPGAPPPQELGAADQHGDLCEVSLTDSAETGQAEARKGSPHDNPTAQPIVQDH
ncbi:hypothetical protein H8958_004773 [Nasalis larvatus]